MSIERSEARSELRASDRGRLPEDQPRQLGRARSGRRGITGRTDDPLVVTWPHFERAEPDVREDASTCVETDVVLPWNALPGQMEQIGGGEWRLIDRPWRVPHTYTLQAVKPAGT